LRGGSLLSVLISMSSMRCRGPVKVKVTAGIFVDGKNVTEEMEIGLEKRASIRDLFRCLDRQEKFPPGTFKKLMKDPGITLLLNGKRLSVPEDLDTELKDGDEVTIISSVAGG